MQKTILIIGGTGIVGQAVVQKCLKENYNVTVISDGKSNEPPCEVQHIVIDKKSDEYRLMALKLPNYDVVFDVIEYDVTDAHTTFEVFKHKTQHLIVLSTTLVYNREERNLLPITESRESIALGEYGGYVDAKVELEVFWLKQSQLPVTLLRAYHILGANSLLGNSPRHNRDPKIVDRIIDEEELALFQGGDILFNFIHPNDLAEIVCRVANAKQCFGQAYNVINPKPYSAKEYFTILAGLLNRTVKIRTISYDEAFGQGWEMTLLPHLYNASKLEQAINFTPQIELEVGISDALAGYPPPIFDTTKIPVFKAMNKGYPPKKITWLSNALNLDNEKKIWNELYDRIATENLAWTGHAFPEPVLNILQQLDKALDTFVVGCGAGDTLHKLAKLNFVTARLFGTDISQFAIEKAKIKYPKLNFKAVATQELLRPCHAHNIFDWLNLHHISPECLEAYLSAIRTNTNDYLLCYIYNAESQLEQPSYTKSSGNIYMHSPKSISNRMIGFEVVEKFRFSITSNKHSKVQKVNQVECLWFQKKSLQQQISANESQKPIILNVV